MARWGFARLTVCRVSPPLCFTPRTGLAEPLRMCCRLQSPRTRLRPQALPRCQRRKRRKERTETALRPLIRSDSMATAEQVRLQAPSRRPRHFFSQVPHPPRARRSSRRARWRRRGRELAGAAAFAWSAVAGAARYEFQFAADVGFNAPVLGKGEDQFFTRNTRATLKKTVPSGTYYWRVRAVSTDGSGLPVVGALGSCAGAGRSRLPCRRPAHRAVVPHPANPLVLRWSAVPRLQVSRDDRRRATRSSARRSAVSKTSRPPGPSLRAARPPPSAGHVLPGRDPDGRAGSPRRPVARYTGPSPGPGRPQPRRLSDLMTETEVFDPFFSWTPVPGATCRLEEVNPTADFSPGSKVCCTRTMIGASRRRWSPRQHMPLARAGTGRVRQRRPVEPRLAVHEDVRQGAAGHRPERQEPPRTRQPVRPGLDLDEARRLPDERPGPPTWSAVPGVELRVDVFPFEGSICDWSDTGGFDNWRIKTASTAWTM